MSTYKTKIDNPQWHSYGGDGGPHVNAIILDDKFPKIVCLCGSTRFSEAFIKAFLDETLDGKIVLTVGNDWRDKRQWQNIDPQKKVMLDELHKRKIDLADEILVLNVGGYIGKSTRSEIEYAEFRWKPIRYLEPINTNLGK